MSGSPGSRGALVVGVGASRGLGAAIARRFAREGFAVTVAGRNEAKLAETYAELVAAGATAALVVGDAADPTDVQRFVRSAEDLAPLEVAIHNAGSNRPAAFLDVTPSSFESHWREHALGGFHLAQAVLPVLTGRGGGSLFFTGASGSLRGRARFAPFASAKAALRALSQSLAREFGPENIHVAHVVVDGGIRGDRLLSALPQAEEQRGPDGLLLPEAIADAFWQLHVQHRSAWSQEIDLRPWSETF